MMQNPAYFLDKAKYYRNLARSHGYVPKSSKTQDPDSDSEYQVIKLEPTGTTSPVIAQVQPQYRRYWDPVKRHYYKIDKIFEEDTQVIQPPAPKDPDIWYPENKLSYQFVRDPETGQLYRVSKTYDASGNYYFDYNKVNYLPEKTPGTNYYRPLYRAE